MRGHWFLLCAIFCLDGCQPADEAHRTAAPAITNGDTDDGDPAVVALRHQGVTICTGTLIAPRVVLTAAHCLALGDDQLDVFLGSDPSRDGPVVAVTVVH